jgi:hypothetical protein
MSFDGLHIVWTTYNYWQPQNAQGVWRHLGEFYDAMQQVGHYCALSKPLPRHRMAINDLPGAAIVLTANEVDDVTDYLAKLIAPGGDRIVQGLPVRHYAVTPTFVQMLIVPALAEHRQAIGRIKSKTSSGLRWGLIREAQPHIWSSGYWFANINGEEAVSKVEQFIRYQQNQMDC